MTSLILNSHTKEGLARLINGRAHAFGIEGRKGTGKRHLAEYIASEIVKISDIKSDPYTLFIDCEEKSGIENTREAIKFLTLKIPGDKPYKRCLIFYSLEKLSHEGQNSLLKSIEEPPEDTLIIVTVESKNMLLPTITSRLSWLRASPITVEEAERFFQTDYGKEKILNAYIVSEGRAYMMQELLDNYDEHPLIISINWAKDILKADRFERLRTVDTIIKSDGFDPKLYMYALSKVLRAAMQSQIEKTGTVNKSLLKSLKLVALAQNTQKYNANQKVVLSRLLYGV